MMSAYRWLALAQSDWGRTRALN